MKKLILSLFVVLMVAGCSTQSSYDRKAQGYLDDFKEMFYEMDTIGDQKSQFIDAGLKLQEIEKLTPPEGKEQFHKDLMTMYQALKDIFLYHNKFLVEGDEEANKKAMDSYEKAQSLYLKLKDE